MKHIEGLDGLRGIAALIVLVSHLYNEAFPLFSDVSLAGIGKSGVYLFFVLSAFLLSAQIREAGYAKLISRSFLTRYLEARFYRILPLFLVVSLVCYVSSLHGFPLLVSMDGAALFETIALQRGDDHLWTIPVEFKFYFFLPPLMVLLVGLLKNRPWPAFLGAVTLLVLFRLLTEPASDGIDPRPFLSVFMAGVAAMYLVAALQKLVATRSRLQLGFEALAWIALGCYVLTIPSVYALLTGEQVARDAFHEAHGVFSALWAALIVGMLLGTGLMRRVLDSKPFVFVGLISYSLYLWHPLMLNLLGPLTDRRLGSILAWYGLPANAVSWLILFGSIGIGAVSYFLVERPVLAWRRRRPRGLVAPVRVT